MTFLSTFALTRFDKAADFERRFDLRATRAGFFLAID